MLKQSEKGVSREMNRRVLRCLVTILVSIMLFMLVTPYALAENTDNDYSRPASSGNTTLSAGDMLSDILGLDVSDAERNYLSIYSDFSFSHASTVPTSYVTTEHDDDSGDLFVHAYEYSYTAVNGVNVLWIPVSAECRGVTKDLTKSDTGYIVSFKDLHIDADNSVKVNYTSHFEISAATVNAFLNLAYSDAPTLKAVMEAKEKEYIIASEKYAEDKLLYDAYLSALSEYEAQLSVYREYLVIKRIYDERAAEYDAYLSALDEYDRATKDYEDYLLQLDKYNSDLAKYQEYLAYLEEFSEKIDAYNIYVEKMSKIKAQLAVLDALKTPVTALNRTLYSAIMGDTVTSVIANKDAITSELVNADGAVVDLAGAATESLRSLMTDYFSITDEAGKYSYYLAHHDEFRDDFADLLRALDKLYLVKRVRGVLIAQEKQEKYLILVAQLYYVANALSDTPISNYDGNLKFDSSYYVGKGYIDEKKPQTILGGVFIADTNDAEPIAGGYPMPVEKPEYTPVPEPVKPVAVKQPVVPEEVANPGEPPDAVDEPISPAVVDDPGEEPVPYTPQKEVLDVIALYDQGKLSHRDEYTSPVAFERTATATKRFYGASTFTVLYFDLDGELIYRTETESGTLADFVGSVPEKEEDISAYYTFSGWMLSNGRIPDLTSVNEDLTLYPCFTPIYKKYTVTWNVSDALHTEDYTWGDIPAYTGTPVKDRTESTYFVFRTWDKEISAVRGDVTYTAIFDEYYIVPFASSGGAKITYSDGVYLADCHGSVVNRFDISELLRLAAGEAGISVSTVNGGASFSYSDTITMRDLGVTEIKISAAQRGTAGYRYSVSLYAGNEELDAPIRATFSASSRSLDVSHLSLYTQSGDERIPVRYSEEEGSIRFLMNVGTSYYASVEYSVTVLPHPNVEIKVNTLSSAPGERVILSCTAPLGVTVGRVYYITDSGERITVDGDRFTMPASDIRLGVDAALTEYTVSFVSDGKVILQYKCHYGDMPIPPSDPKRSASSAFTYTFKGWSDEMSPVVEDVTYTANYIATPIEKKPDDGGLQITPSVMRLLVLGATALVICFVGILPSSVMCLVLFIRRRRISKMPKKGIPRE